MYIMQRTFSLQ